MRADDLRRENGYDRGIDQAYNVSLVHLRSLLHFRNDLLF